MMWVCLCAQDVDLYHERTRYFGVSELLESTHSGSSLPLMRYDSSFESMASALEERYTHSVLALYTSQSLHFML